MFTGYPLRAGQSAGVSNALAARLNPPPLPTWVFWSTSAAAGLVAGFFGFAFSDAQSQYTALARRAATEPVPGADLTALAARTSERAGAANAALFAAGSLVLAAGIEALFTDWAGARDAFAPQAAAVRVVPGGVHLVWR
jgi:hypothetical protein